MMTMMIMTKFNDDENKNDDDDIVGSLWHPSTNRPHFFMLCMK